MARILVISPTPSHPQNAGNRARVFTLLCELQRAGHEIHFLYLKKGEEHNDELGMMRQWDGFNSIPCRLPRTRFAKKAHDLLWRAFGRNQVLPYRIDDWFDFGTLDSVLETAKGLKPDIVMVEYVFLSRIFEFFDDSVLKILDTHDVFGGREKIFTKNGLEPKFFYTSEVEEKKGLERADIILAIQSQEAKYFTKLVDRKVLTIGHIMRPVKDKACEFSNSPKLLFVASSNHVNRNGINWFLREVFEDLRRKIPDIEMDVVGGIGDFISPSPGLNLHGIVNDLAPFYRNASVVINPTTFGTGLKIKTIEALAMNKPLVTTPVGAAGIQEWSGRAFLCASTPEQFGSSILKIIDSRDLRVKLAKGSHMFLSEYNLKALLPLQKEISSFLAGNEIDDYFKAETDEFFDAKKSKEFLRS